MKKQTAIDWLVQELKSNEYLGTFCTADAWPKEEEIMRGIINQAKEMEKEQHSETFNQGVQWMQYHRDLVNGGSEYWEREPLYFLGYYKETYGE